METVTTRLSHKNPTFRTKQGEWTIDYMSELVSNEWIDENSDGVISDGDTVGFSAPADISGDGGMDAWIPAMGISLTKINLDADIAQKYEANKVKYENALNSLIDKLDEISFIAG